MHNGLKLRIFLVEDHHIMRRGLASLLRTELNAEIVGEAKDGLEALDLLADVHPDAIVMDIAMPRMNGIEASRRIRQKYPGPHILILSMHNNPRLVEQALQAGASGYVLKDAMVEELAQALRAIMSGAIFVSPQVEGVSVEAILQHGYTTQPAPAQELTPREVEILRLLADGKTVAQIAAELCLSIYTVYTHKSNIKQKLNLHNTAEIIRFAMQHGHSLSISPADEISEE